MKKRILFVNHFDKECGVHQFGDIIGNALLDYSEKFYWRYEKISDKEVFWNIIKSGKIDAVVFNYHPGASSLAYSVVPKTYNIPTFAIVHEKSWFETDHFLDEFDYLIAPDITLQDDAKFLHKHRLFATNRTIPKSNFLYDVQPKITTIGSFGFGFGGKGYEKIIEAMHVNFKSGLIKLHIPSARFGDADGANARERIKECMAKMMNPNIELRISTHFMDRDSLIYWLSENTINCFFYDSFEGRGISSAIDFALAARKPIAISDSYMFRHLDKDSIRINYDYSNLKDIIDMGTKPLERFYKWTEENTVAEYERIMEIIL